MTTSELQATVRERDGVAVIDLTGDLNSSAEDALNEAYAQATGTGADSVVLNFERAEYINSTGIALIVGAPGAGAGESGAGEGIRAVGPLPRDLRDHAAGRLHDNRRRRRARRERRRREALMPEAATTFDVRELSEGPARSTSRATSPPRASTC